MPVGVKRQILKGKSYFMWDILLLMPTNCEDASCRDLITKDLILRTEYLGRCNLSSFPQKASGVLAPNDPNPPLVVSFPSHMPVTRTVMVKPPVGSILWLPITEKPFPTTCVIAEKEMGE